MVKPKKKKDDVNNDTILLFKNITDNIIIDRTNNLPWIEKYKPQKIDDLLLDHNLLFKLKNFIKNGVIPNLIIYGQSGIGKTITVSILIKEILKNRYKDAMIELNASDNRGLEIINNTIVYFCKKKLDHNKVIILDEADSITKKAQNLISNLMEEFYDNTRFCLTCNDSNKLIESIQSRCLILYFKPISYENIYKKLEYICNKEKIEFNKDGLDAIISISQGDIRQAINNLEAVYYAFNVITKNNIYKLCYQPNPEYITELIKASLSKNIKQVIIILLELKKNGYCNSDILQTLISTLKNINIDENIRINYIRIFSECYININEGIDSILQLYGCFSKIIKWTRYKVS